jgi:hypothetical protein
LERNEFPPGQDFSGCNFDGSIMRWMKAEESDLSGSSFVGSDCSHMQVSGGNLSHCDFSNAKMTGANMSSCDVSNSKFLKTECIIMSFSKSNLESCDFENASADCMSMEEANLKSVSFLNASISGSILTLTNLDGVNFKNTAIGATCLDPKGEFDPPTDEEILAAGLSVDGEYIVGWAIGNDKEYIPGNLIISQIFSFCNKTEKHPGLYLNKLNYFLTGDMSNSVLVQCRCLKSETVHIGNVWRTKKLWVL